MFHAPSPPGFSKLSRIGCGTYSTVYSGVHTQTGIQVAIKCIDKTFFDDDEVGKAALKKEAEIHEALSHNNIAVLYGKLEDQFYIYFIVEFVAGRPLIDIINQLDVIGENTAREYAEQLVSAVKYLHELGVIHRDLKVENIMVDNKKVIKVIDFGFSNRDQTIYTTTCGSLGYLAPEMIRGEAHTCVVDVWSCGICIYAMLCGKLPFTSDNTGQYIAEVEKHCPEFPDSVSALARDLVMRMLIPDPTQRPTMSEVADHPWIQGDVMKRRIPDICGAYVHPTVLGKTSDSMRQHGKATRDNEGMMMFRILRHEYACAMFQPTTRRLTQMSLRVLSGFSTGGMLPKFNVASADCSSTARRQISVADKEVARSRPPVASNMRHVKRPPTFIAAEDEDFPPPHRSGKAGRRLSSFA